MIGKAARDGYLNCRVTVKTMSVEIALASYAPTSCDFTIKAQTESIEALAESLHFVLSDHVDQTFMAQITRPFEVFMGHGGNPQ